MKPRKWILRYVAASSICFLVSFNDAFSKIYDYPQDTLCGRIDDSREETIKRVFVSFRDAGFKVTDILKEIVECKTRVYRSEAFDTCVIKVHTQELMSLLTKRSYKDIGPALYLPDPVLMDLTKHDLQVAIYFPLGSFTTIYTSHHIFTEYPESTVLIRRDISCTAVEHHM